MPTIYTDCIDCKYYKNLSLDHHFNSEYKKTFEKERILVYLGLPIELAQKIIKLSIPIKQCIYCNIKLCEYHINKQDNSSIIFSNKPNIICYNCWCH